MVEAERSRNKTPADFAPAGIEVERRDNGETILRCPRPLQPFERSLGAMLERQARDCPDTPFVAERLDDGWRSISYREAYERALTIGEGLLHHGLGPGRPLMILSVNSIDCATLILGCYLAGVPAAPVSPAYAAADSNFERLRHVYEQLAPGMLYVGSVDQFSNALEALPDSGVPIVSSSPGAASAIRPFDTLCERRPGDAIRRAADAVDGTTVAKYLFTSGSTGRPKGVINTHGMLCANQQMVAQCWPFLDSEPPVVVDWLPWNHTFGGNKVFHMVLRNGGTLYIDSGKPAPELIATSVENLKKVSPTVYFNVPAGFAQLVTWLERDKVLCESFFRRLRMIFFAAAAMPQNVWDRIDELAVHACGRRIPMMSGYGTTETGPVATLVHFPMDNTRVIGLPSPGVEIKMAETGNKTELRIRGPNVTTGYLNDPERTRLAFDEEGFYCSGDAGAFLDADQPEKGLVFNGRVAEDFKLTTGTWVSVGMLRLKALDAVAPLLQDVVVAGEDRDYVGLLAWINVAACRHALNLDDRTATVETLAGNATLRDLIRRGLAEYNVANRRSSARVDRVLLMTDLPDPDAGEITDKGYINQRAVLDHRQKSVRRLYADQPGPDVIAIPPGPGESR